MVFDALDCRGISLKKIVLLGSTGSIGTQTLDIIQHHRDEYKVVGLSCKKSIDLLIRQIEQFKPESVCIEDKRDAERISDKFENLEVFYGKQGLKELAEKKADILLNALVGISGLEPTLVGINTGKDIALANKETLVTGGSLVMNLAREKGVNILPVDSEHSAIFQALQGNQQNKISRILLTASGGPFRHKKIADLKEVTVKEALNHPKWKMGKKITIDSATLMNKGLEVIEAKWLFDVKPHQIEVVVHPESIVHSMVEYKDNSIMAQLGSADMRIPISYALAYPKRLENHFQPINFVGECGRLNFEHPDRNTFKTLDLAYEVLEKGGTYPVALNGANEVLVEAFLQGKIKFLDIQDMLRKVLDEFEPCYDLTLENILEADKKARRITENLLQYK